MALQSSSSTSKEVKNKEKYIKKKFMKPTSIEIQAFIEKEFNRDEFSAAGLADNIFLYYQSKGWVVGKSPMKDWQAAVRRWLKQENERNPINGPTQMIL